MTSLYSALMRGSAFCVCVEVAISAQEPQYDFPFCLASRIEFIAASLGAGLLSHEYSYDGILLMISIDLSCFFLVQLQAAFPFMIALIGFSFSFSAWLNDFSAFS